MGRNTRMASHEAVEPIGVLIVVGTRPEAIKFAPVIVALRDEPAFRTVVCSTGQHKEMLTQVLASFGLAPDVDLNIMRPGQSLPEVSAAALQGLDAALARYQPAVCLVQGDTTSAMCGALAAYYRNVMVGHIEAGLRTGNPRAPFPEEINRRIIGQIAQMHFAPTERARAALLREGVDPKDVVVTGNTVIDALLATRDRVRSRRGPSNQPQERVLVTAHRRESFGPGFERICAAIRHLADTRPNTHFVFPVHMNPNVREPVDRVLRGHPRIELTEPLGYEDFVAELDRCTLVLTDSGGVQEEAPSLGKPVLVMRDTTERPEGVHAGNARLVGTDYHRIVGEVSLLLDDASARLAMSQAANPYGDGRAAERIVGILRERLGVGPALIGAANA